MNPLNLPITAQTMSQLVDTIDTLEARWYAESEYEDFAEYRHAWEATVRQLIPDATSITLRRKPFMGSFQTGEHVIGLKVSARGVTLTATNAPGAPERAQEARS